MQTGVDDQPHRPQLHVVEVAEPLMRVGEQPERRPQRLGVQSPAFDVGDIECTEAPELRQLSSLLCDRDLEMVAW
jgi:hypothetical protein